MAMAMRLTACGGYGACASASLFANPPLVSSPRLPQLPPPSFSNGFCPCRLPSSTRSHPLGHRLVMLSLPSSSPDGPGGAPPGYGNNGGGGGNDDFSNGDDPPPRTSIFSWYLLLLNNHPIATKSVTSALLTLFGDIFAQFIIEKRETIDTKRLGIFTFLGLVLVAPTLHFWYLTLSKLIPGPGIPKAGLRLTLDQFLFSPLFIGVFFSTLLVLEGHANDIVPKLRQDWLSAVITNWKIWIPFQFFNFLLVPQQLQVLGANVIALAWNTYLSFATHKVLLPAPKDGV